MQPMHICTGLTSSGDMFQKKMDDIFKQLPNIFATADNILIVCYNHNSADHDKQYTE